MSFASAAIEAIEAIEADQVKDARARQATNPPQDSLHRKAVNAQALDPRLADHMVKNEPSQTPSPHFADRPYPPPVFAPKMSKTWPSPFSNTTASFSNPGLEGSDVFTERSEPCSRAVTPPAIDTAAANAGMGNDNGEVVIDATMVSEASKLKGIYWPGMDIFDSATPEMKRKRNQKKDVSVVEQLETNSQEVAATELIWTPCGTLKKERPISGSVTDSSPIKLDASPFRAPLIDLETNRVVRQTRTFARRPARNRRKSPKKRSAHDLVLEDEMDQKAALRSRKGAIDVYKDRNDEPFGRSTSMSTLTAEFHHPSHQSQSSFTQQQPQQHLGQLQQHAGQPQQHQVHHAHQQQQQQQPDFLQVFDFRTTDLLQPTYDPLGFGYHQPNYFDGPFGYSAPPFQAFNPQPDLTGGLGGSFANHNGPWMTPNPFQTEDADFKPQAEEVDDERTITAPATPNH